MDVEVNLRCTTTGGEGRAGSFNRCQCYPLFPNLKIAYIQRYPGSRGLLFIGTKVLTQK